MSDYLDRLKHGRAFLRMLHGSAAGRNAMILIWCKSDARGHFFASCQDAAVFALRQAKEGRDVYFGCGLYRDGITAGRGKAADVAYLTALWADIDLGEKGFADIDAAMQWLARVEPQPSLIVASGNGLHAYWRLKSPLPTTEADASTLPKRWIEYLNAQARAAGAKLDSVGDLARVLRIPGTFNRKRSPAESVVMFECTRNVYDAAEFEQRIRSTRPRHERTPPKGKPNGAELAKIRRTLRSLSPARATVYGDWLKVGMAVHSAFPGSDGLVLWDEFSQRTTAKNYNAETCRQKWQSFHQEGGVTLGTIHEMAAEDKGQPQPHDPHEIAAAVLDNQFWYEGKLTLRFYRGGWWRWEDGHYRHVATREMRAQFNRDVRRQLDALAPKTTVTRNMMNNVVDAMEGLCLLRDVVALPSWIGKTPCPGDGDLLAMENGLLDLAGVLADPETVLHRHTPDWFSVTRWTYAYDPTAKCPKWKRFLSEVLPGKRERQLLQEFVGYCLTSSTKRHRFLVLHGEGANGKSVITEVVTEVLGRDNVTHVGLERFGERFALAPTIGKLANIVSELGAVKGVAEDVLKAITSGDRIHVEFKHQTPFDARPTIRLVFATNELPPFADRSEGLWRRLLILPFTVQIPNEKQDLDLARRISETELPGILNWAIRGLRRLEKNNRFTIPDSTRTAIMAHRRECDPARDFLETKCVASPGDRIPSGELFQKYRDWCSAHDHRPLAEQQFGREVRRVFRAVERRQVREGSFRRYYYFGIAYSTRRPRWRVRGKEDHR